MELLLKVFTDKILPALLWILFLGAVSGILWGFGWWAKRAMVGRVASGLLALALLVVGAVILFSGKNSPFVIQIRAPVSSVKNITFKKMPVDLKVKVDGYVDGSLLFSDTSGREYHAAVPKEHLLQGAHEYYMYGPKFMAGLLYVLFYVGQNWILIAWWNVLAFVVGAGLSFAVWYAGHEGVFVMLIPDDD